MTDVTEAEAPKLSDRFEPEPGKPYGHCVNCDPRLEFADKASADAHMHETHEAAKATSKLGVGRGHGIRVTNPERQSRVESEVRSIIDSAITEAIEDLGRLTYSHLVRSGSGERHLPDATEAEITEALKWFDDFQEGWREYLEENEYLEEHGED